MTIVTNIHLLRPVFTIQGYIPSPRGPDLSFSRWRRCYKSRRSFPVYLASEVQKRSNVPVPGQKLATKVSKPRAIPPYVPGVNPPGWPLISALRYGPRTRLVRGIPRYIVKKRSQVEILRKRIFWAPTGVEAMTFQIPVGRSNHWAMGD